MNLRNGIAKSRFFIVSFECQKLICKIISMKSPNNLHLFINDCYGNVINHQQNDIEKSFIKNVDNNAELAKQYCHYLVEIEKQLKADLDFFFESDPAANSLDEIVLSYPGFLAICYYRLAHPLYLLGYKVESRFIAEQAHKITGIDIHPGATIDSPFFIDHGTGIVIGETAIVGQRVKIYQGVTLGALSLSRGHTLKGTKRHPTIGNDVTIYSGVSILGDIKVGDDVVLGSNVFITEDIPSHVKVTISKPVLVYIKK